jgi:osmoprotectant transport system permease protein
MIPVAVNVAILAAASRPAAALAAAALAAAAPAPAAPATEALPTLLRPTSLLGDAAVWVNDPNNWSGPNGITALTLEHLAMSAIAVLAAAAIALPLGIWLGHTGRGASFTVVAANTSRALPTLALLTLFATSAIGFGNRATVLAVTIFAIPPILTNSYAGIRGVDPDIRDAATGMGMSPTRVLHSVSIPLSLPLIGAGLRLAAVQVVATIPLAALVGGGGLGVIIATGIATQRYGKAFAGAVLVAAICLAVEGVLALAQRALTPLPIRVLARTEGG